MRNVFYVFQAATPAPATSPMSYESFLTIVLTALCVILAALALVIGILALWGYKGIKDSVTQSAVSKAEKALATKMAEYPAAKELIDIVQKFQEHVHFMESIREQMAAGGANNVAEVQNIIQDESVDDLSTDSIAADYPSAQEGEIDGANT